MDAASRLREYAGDGTVLGDDVAEVLAELDAARAESARLRAHLAAARRRKEADRARLTALEAAGRLVIGSPGYSPHLDQALDALRIALDAVPAAETGSGAASSRCGEPG